LLPRLSIDLLSSALRASWKKESSMSATVQISPGVYSLGARHPELAIFDELFPTRNGTTYTAYLIKGSERTALIDTVKAPFAEEYLARVRELVPLEQIDLVVVNHTEPDHSGALPQLLAANPNLTVVCSRPGENFLRQILNHPFQARIVGDGEAIELGGKTLRFLLAPHLHWPDTMFTYLLQDQLLFSCDAFGAHFCGEGLFDDQTTDFSEDFAYYFDTIMRPFKEHIRAAVAKVEELPLRMICPSHGPLLRRQPRQAIAQYREWAAAPPDSGGKKVLLVTLSPHGSTREMAHEVRIGLENKGLEVVEHTLVEASEQQLRDELERCDALLVATPTINRDAPPPVWRALSLLSSVTPKGKIGAVFGSYGWSGEAVKLVEERLRGLKYQLAVPGFFLRFRPTEADRQHCREFGAQVADVMLELAD
jgi:NADH oxidase (H2O-forming)